MKAVTVVVAYLLTGTLAVPAVEDRRQMLDIPPMPMDMGGASMGPSMGLDMPNVPKQSEADVPKENEADVPEANEADVPMESVGDMDGAPGMSNVASPHDHSGTANVYGRQVNKNVSGLTNSGSALATINSMSNLLNGINSNTDLKSIMPQFTQDLDALHNFLVRYGAMKVTTKRQVTDIIGGLNNVNDAISMVDSMSE